MVKIQSYESLTEENKKLRNLLKRVVKMTAIYEEVKVANNVDCFGYYKLIKQIKQALGEN